MKGPFAAAAVVLYLGMLPATAAPPPSRPLRIGVAQSLPYQAWVEGTGAVGFTVELVNRAAGRRGIPLQWVHRPEGPQQALGRNEADLWPLVAILATKKAGLHAGKPWLKNQYAIVWLGDGTPIPAPEPDWRGRTISHLALPLVTEIAKTQFPRADFAGVTERRLALENLCSGAAQGAFMEVRLLEALLLRRPPGCRDQDFRVRVLSEPVVELSVASRPEYAAYADALSDELQNMFLSGEAASAVDRWFVFSNLEAYTLSQLREERRNTTAALWSTATALLLLGVVLFLYQRARQSTEQAQAADRAKSEFLANVTHEVRTPMNGVIGMTDLLLETPLTVQQREYAITIRESAQLQLTVLNDILDLSRLQSGRFDLDPEPCAPRDLFRNAARPFEALAMHRGLRFEVTFSAQLPEAAALDGTRVRQIVTNLLHNALKFTETGEVRLHVWMDSGMLCFHVQDTGVGIPQELQSRIFEKFTQADHSTTRRYGGSGLGLTICHQLVQAMGGDITLASTPGKGSTFTCRISCQPAVASAPAQVDAVAMPLQFSAPFPILLVEDNLTNQKVAERLLQSMGLEVRVAVNGRQAVLLHATERFSAIVMDCQMPEMDGYEATRLIRQAEAGRPQTPIIALTAGATSTERDLAIRSGMDQFVTKPVSKVSLADALQRYLTASADRVTTL